MWFPPSPVLEHPLAIHSARCHPEGVLHRCLNPACDLPALTPVSPPLHSFSQFTPTVEDESPLTYLAFPGDFGAGCSTSPQALTMQCQPTIWGVPLPYTSCNSMHVSLPYSSR